MHDKKEVMSIFQLLRLIRDARSTKKANRELLNALALRCQPAKNFISWPSYRLLAKDTLLDEVTLMRAASKLEDAKLIRRVKRANRSNCFFINVALLQAQAAKVKAAEDAAKEASEEAAKLGTENSPFEQPVLADAEEDEADAGGWNVGGAR